MDGNTTGNLRVTGAHLRSVALCSPVPAFRRETEMKAMALATVVFAALFVCLPAAARVIDKDYHETFDAEQGTKLLLFHGDGDVTITPWDRDVIDVKVRYHAEVTSVGIGKEVDFSVDFKQTGDTIVVRGHEGGTAGIFFFRSMSEYAYTYTVSAPSYVILELRGDDGDVEVSGWRADIDCVLDDGDLDLDDVVAARVEIGIEDGDVRLTELTTNLDLRGDDGDVVISGGTFEHGLLSIEDGDIDVMDSAGDFEISVDDGDIDFARVAVANMDVRGNDGDVDLDVTIEPETHIAVSTDDGDVTMRLSGELSFDYLITMDDGDVDVYLDDATDTEADEHRVSGTVGAGEGNVRVRTSDGDVTILTGD